ncbi:MAG: histidine kinase dimerization/phospho-acceptor domain-containing protein, partial [Mariprofundales bacterium]|nr:histidine kinase dimerization/phospho-acceptor domain-containing protein [Mariprofundales bacterium]
MSGVQDRVIALQQQVDELSEQLRQAELRLQSQGEHEQAVRIKTAVLANLSHEIRTPMNAIIGFTQLMDETELTEQQSYYLQQIILSGNTLMRMMESLLDLAQLESGAVELDHHTFVL